MLTWEPFRRMAKRERSRLLRMGTVFIWTGGLAAFLILWLLLARPSIYLEGIDLGRDVLHAPGTLFREGDVAGVDELAKSHLRAEPRNQADLKRLDQFLASHEDRPVLIYLAAPGVLLDPEDRLDDKIWTGVLPLDKTGRLDIREILQACRQRPRQKILLLLDVGGIGSDLDLGLFANDFLRQVVELESKPTANLGILCACAPYQLSWSSEADRRSVFGQVVAEELLESRNVAAFIDNVRRRVAYWVAENRDAIQTPIYLGDPSFLDAESPAFKLPKVRTPVAVAPTDPKSAVAFWKDLHTKQIRRDAHQERRPYRYAPLAWRDYQQALVEAELLGRAGRFLDARRSLDEAANIEGRLKVESNTEYGSLALGLQLAFEPSDLERIRKLDQDLENAIKAEIEVARPVMTANAKDPAAVPVTLASRILSGTNPWRDVVEGQLIDWCTNYAKIPRVDNEALLPGPRLEQIANAIKVRRLAEKAAATWWAGRWTHKHIDDGDLARRKAQDLLFIGDSDRVPEIVGLLDTARVAYQRAHDIADAVDLLGRVQSEAPVLGTWYARHQASTNLDLDSTIFDEIVEASNRILEQLHAKPTDRSPTVDIEALVGARNDLARPFDKLLRLFEAALLHADEEGNWRRIDDLLTVPMIDAETRRKLVLRAHNLSLEVAFQSPAPADGVAVAAKPTRTKELAQTLLSGGTSLRSLANPGRLDGSGSSAPSTFDGSNRSRVDEHPAGEPDPGFARLAYGLELVEWMRLATGVVSTEDRAAPREAIRATKDSDAVLRDPDKVTRLASDLRRLRRRQSDLAKQPLGGLSGDNDDDHAHAQALRMLVSLPSHLAAGESAKVEQTLDQFRRRTMLVRQAQRLLEDFDPARAQKCLKLASNIGETQAAEKARAAVKGLMRNPLITAVAAFAPDSSRKEAQEASYREIATKPLTMDVNITIDPVVPRGVATLLTIPDRNPVKLALNPHGELGSAVDFKPGARSFNAGASPNSQLKFELHRLFFEGNQDVEVELRPVVFYRGHSQPATALQLVLPLIKEHCEIAIRTPPKALSSPHSPRYRKRYHDQFEYHPEEAYIYPDDSRHPYELVFTYPTEVDVILRRKLGSKVEDKKMHLNPGEPTVGFTDEITNKILSDDADGTPLDVEVVLDVPNRPVISHKRFTFHRVPYQTIYEIKSYHEGDELSVVIYRPIDKIVREVSVKVQVEGLTNGTMQWSNASDIQPQPIANLQMGLAYVFPQERVTFVFKGLSPGPAGFKYQVIVGNCQPITRVHKTGPPPTPAPQAMPMDVP